MSTSNTPRIGITLGDCAGIGPEIVDLALNSYRIARTVESKVIGKYPGSRPGNPTAESARAAATALEEAVTLALRGELDAIVTGPVHKARMYEVGFKFPGQTEFFAERCGVKNFAMCLTGRKITVALVTTHIPLREAASALKQSEIVRVGLLLADFLKSQSVSSPRIAVAGLAVKKSRSSALRYRSCNRKSRMENRESLARFPPTQFFTVQLKVNSMRFSACITIRV